MKFIFALFFLLSFSMPSYAGDYMLLICNDKAYYKDSEHNSSWQVRTADEVIADIQLYASGGEPEGIFRAAFANNHLDFCTSWEKDIVRAGIEQALLTAKKQRVDDLSYFLRLLGPEQDAP